MRKIKTTIILSADEAYGLSLVNSNPKSLDIMWLGIAVIRAIFTQEIISVVHIDDNIYVMEYIDANSENTPEQELYFIPVDTVENYQYGHIDDLARDTFVPYISPLEIVNRRNELTGQRW